MKLALSTLAVTCIPLYASPAPYGHAKRFETGTAASIRIESREVQPTMTFMVEARDSSVHESALDWISLSHEALPNTEPMTAEERSSINDFFWSHF